MKSTKGPLGIRDNRSRGPVHEFLTSTVGAESELSIVSAYFTASAYGVQRTTLDPIASARFLFREPPFLSIADAETFSPPVFAITEAGPSLVA